ncbi:hypothetical protein NL676_008313 [Syzygium grande]|nr:hypothetical protein NL676_008313 [Syzygium grande]
MGKIVEKKKRKKKGRSSLLDLQKRKLSSSRDHHNHRHQQQRIIRRRDNPPPHAVCASRQSTHSLTLSRTASLETDEEEDGRGMGRGGEGAVHPKTEAPGRRSSSSPSKCPPLARQGRRRARGWRLKSSAGGGGFWGVRGVI